MDCPTEDPPPVSVWVGTSSLVTGGRGNGKHFVECVMNFSVLRGAIS